MRDDKRLDVKLSLVITGNEKPFSSLETQESPP